MLARCVEQLHILDRDHRLVSEGLQQPDLFLGEGLPRHAACGDRTDGLAIVQQWNGDRRLEAHELVVRIAVGGKALIGRHVRRMHRPAFQHRATDDVVLARRLRVQAAEHAARLGARLAVGRDVEHAAVVAVEDAEYRAAKTVRVLDDRVEHRLRIRGGARQRAQNLGCRRLLLDRLLAGSLRFRELAGLWRGASGPDASPGDAFQVLRLARRGWHRNRALTPIYLRV